MKQEILQTLHASRVILQSLYTYTFVTDKMDQSHEKYELLQLTQYEIDNVNIPITINDIEFLV